MTDPPPSPVTGPDYDLSLQTTAVLCGSFAANEDATTFTVAR